MTRRVVYLTGERQKEYAKTLVDQSASDDVMRISKRTRSTDQNAKLWSMIADIMNSPNNERPDWSAEAWKCGLMMYCGHEIKWDRGLGNCGPIPLGFRSSKLTVKEMSALIECTYSYGAEHGVQWTDFEKSMERRL